MKHQNKITSLLISLSLFFTVGFIFSNQVIEDKSDNFDLKVSVITSPITINDATPGSDWAWARTQPWFGGGTGSPSNPYILEDLIIDGGGLNNGITIYNSNAHFKIENCTIFNVISGYCGFQLWNVTNGALTTNNCSNIDNGFFLTLCSHNDIIGNIIDSTTAGNGLMLVSSHNNTIDNNLIKDKLLGIWLKTSSDNTITDNTVDDSGANGIILSDDSEYNTISRNSVHNTLLYDGIQMTDSNNNTISENIISYNNEEGIHIDGSEGNTVTHNSIFNNKQTGIKLRTIDGSGFNNRNNLIGNTIYDHSRDGIFSVEANYTIISENIIYNNYQSGIDLDACNNNTLSNNVIFDNLMAGINISAHLGDPWSNHNNIIENTIYHNNESGIDIGCNSWNNDIWDNHIYDNTIHAIFLRNASYGENHGNWIYDNGETGIYCDLSSAYNNFYENLFVGNIKHAIDNGFNNDWNSTTIGNFWDNHTEPDTNPQDGVVDIQYNITGSAGSIDYLPIAEDGAPRINILSPTEGDLFNESAPDFVITITEDYLVSRWYKINNSATNYAFTDLSGTIDQSAWEALSDGNFTLRFYARDLAGNTGSRETIIQRDTQAPVITINSPTSGDEFGSTPPTINITVTDPNLNSTWYTFDGNITILDSILVWTIPQEVWDALPEGSATIRVYANDTLGHTSSQSLTLTKNIPSSKGIGLDYFTMGILTTLFSSVAILAVITKMYRKQLNTQ